MGTRNEDTPLTIAARNGYAGVGEDDDYGLTMRIVDPVTGAGLFTNNMDPQKVGIDPVTGSYAPTGTDISFGSAILRQIQTGIVNGDFSQPPPGGAGSLVSPYSDAGSSGYNAYPGWDWHPPSDASESLTCGALLVATYPPRWNTLIVGGAGLGYMEQWIRPPVSTGQQFRVLSSFYTNGGTRFRMDAQWYQADAVTTVGSVISISGVATGESKGDLGLVPTPNAGLYLQLRIYHTTINDGDQLYEVRAPAVPAEVSVGIGSLSAATGALSGAEQQVKGVTIPANTFTVGSVYRISGFGQVTSSVANNVTFRVRCGTSSLAGVIPLTRIVVGTTTASTDDFSFDFMLTVTAVGASGHIIGGGPIVGSNTQPFAQNAYATTAASVVIDTTVARILELTIQTAAGTTTVNFLQASIVCVNS